MAALRFASMLFALIATVVLATDVMRAGNGSAPSIWTPLARHWGDLSPNSFAATRKSIQSLHPLAWDYGAQPVLRLPGWLIFGSLAVVTGYLGRHRRRVDIFTN